MISLSRLYYNNDNLITYVMQRLAKMYKILHLNNNKFFLICIIIHSVFVLSLNSVYYNDQNGINL